MHSFHRPTYVEIDLKKLVQNYNALRLLLPPGTFFCPMVKANAYGHGDVEVAKVLEKAGCPSFGVGLIEEAALLRQGGIKTKILNFGVFDEKSVAEVLHQEITPVLSDWSQLETLKTYLKTPLDVHIKFNTGMNRLGFAVGEAKKLREFFSQNPKLKLQGICTHLMRGEDAGVIGGESESQLVHFDQALESFRGLNFQIHALNSSALANFSERHRLGVPPSAGTPWPLGARPGIALYGTQPATIDQVKLPVEPILSWKTHVVKMHRLQPGERVSYNGTWEAGRKSLIGVLPVGYADGYFRLLSNRGTVLCNGMRAPVIGTICMDYFMIDLTDVEKQVGSVQIGAEVVLLGEQGTQILPVEELATKVGTIPYEIFTHITERVPRVYVGKQ